VLNVSLFSQKFSFLLKSESEMANKTSYELVARKLTVLLEIEVSNTK